MFTHLNVSYLTLIALLTFVGCSRNDDYMELPNEDTTLSISLETLILSVNDTALSNSLAGKPRKITVTNNGPLTAENVTYTISPTLPAGSSVAPSDCSSIAVGASCTLTITPGATASAAAGDLSPTPLTLEVTADNSEEVFATLHIVTYGSVLQSGYIFSVDDTTDETESIGAKIVGLQDQDTAGIIWSSNGTSGTAVDTVFDNIAGIYQNSASPPDACAGATDGKCNSEEIETTYNAIDNGFFAQGLCQGEIDDFNDWYLPSICELGYDHTTVGTTCGSAAAATIQNIQLSLVDNGDIGTLSGDYWSSTLNSADAANEAWVHHFDTAAMLQQSSTKDNLLNVRCVRELSL